MSDAAVDAFVAESADVSPDATIGDGSAVWHLAQIRERASVGRRCVVGRGAYIGAGVEIGDDCKVQNSALVYEPAHIANGVFIGPGAILTNDANPRAVTPDGRIKTSRDWTPVGVTIWEGASIGAGAICVAPVTIGAWAMVAAGAVVVDDVRPFALVAGVPASQIGWVGRAGHRLLRDQDAAWACPVSTDRYVEVDGDLRLEAP